MKPLKKSINNAMNTNTGVVRFKYEPYKLAIAKKAWMSIAQKIISKEIEITTAIAEVWTNLIMYVHGDDRCKYDLTKTICLMGMTGSGKSDTMKILNQYIAIDNVRFKRSGKIVPLAFNIFSAREIVADFDQNGYDGIDKYMIYSSICIDDLGTEPPEAVYYGTRVNVIPEIIETRYSKGLTTHLTTNLNFDLIKDKYNDRVHSRLTEHCNKIILNDKDFRNSESTLF